MASHHEKNSKAPSAAPLDSPASATSVSKLNVTYSRGADAPFDTPTSPTGIRPTSITPGTGAIEVDGPNTPNPMSNTGDH